MGFLSVSRSEMTPLIRARDARTKRVWREADGSGASGVIGSVSDPIYDFGQEMIRVTSKSNGGFAPDPFVPGSVSIP